LLDLIWGVLFDSMDSLLLACLPAEHTFIVLDKELIEGEFSPGNPHTEG
jgi:hypothetical protein